MIRRKPSSTLNVNRICQSRRGVRAQFGDVSTIPKGCQHADVPQMIVKKAVVKTIIIIFQAAIRTTPKCMITSQKFETIIPITARSRHPIRNLGTLLSANAWARFCFDFED